MVDNKSFEVIIIGGSYAGLSCALALGRALRSTLIIDSGRPCNQKTPHSHNFLTQDGAAPNEITGVARAQVLKYNTIALHPGAVIGATKSNNSFLVTTEQSRFTAKKLIFASGLKDIMPDIKGFSECWGVSVLHCPYCHGYEVRNTKTALIANDDFALQGAKLLTNWSKELILFTNGKSKLTQEQTEELTKHNIPIIETEIDHLKHRNGKVQQIILKDQSGVELNVIYARPNIQQHCRIPEILGCELTEQGLIKIDMMQKTTVKNVFACGDNSNPMRSVASAVAAGNFTGAVVNNELRDEEF